MTRLLYTLALLSAVLPVSKAVFASDFILPSDSRIKMLPYDESDVYTITTKYGYQTSVIFDQNETIQTISMGDRSLWQIIPVGNRMFIRPMDDNLLTNMTVITDKRAYNFDVKSVGSDAKNTSIMYVAQFIYPDYISDSLPDISSSTVNLYDDTKDSTVFNDTLSQTIVPATAASQSGSMPDYKPAKSDYSYTQLPTVMPEIIKPAPAISGVQHNYSYSYAGPDDLAPLQVFDNGKSTFFKYVSVRQPLPNAYIVDSTGQTKPVAHYVENDLMVIDDIAGEWLLKSSAGDIIVYNEIINPQ